MKPRTSWKLISINPITAQVFRGTAAIGTIVRVNATRECPFDRFELVTDSARHKFRSFDEALQASGG